MGMLVVMLLEAGDGWCDLERTAEEVLVDLLAIGLVGC